MIDQFVKYIQYTRKLGFDETPDYNWLRGLFLDLLKNLEEPAMDDGIFDWQLLNEGKKGGWQSLADERRQAKNAPRKLLVAPPLNSQAPQNEYVKAHYQTLKEGSNNNNKPHHYSAANNNNNSSDSTTRSKSAWSKIKSLFTSCCGYF